MSNNEDDYNVGPDDELRKEGDEDMEADEAEVRQQTATQIVVEPDELTEASGVQLHMVYSGRGDAFYLTWRTVDATPHMIMVDAGPYKYDARGNAAAPYWEYLAWAGRRIWANLAPNLAFKLDLIINTHPHDDHIGGLVQLLSLPANSPLAFPPCPIVLPAYYSAPAQIEIIHEQTIAKGWKVSKFSEYADPRASPAGVIVKYPTLSERVVLDPAVNGKVPENERQSFLAFHKAYFTDITTSEDKSLEKDLNYASLLLKSSFKTTGQGDNVVKSQVFLTGDNDGKIISKYVKDEKLSVYKIQHHGSRFESMGVKVPSIPAWFRAETAVFFTLLYRYKDDPAVPLLQPLYYKFVLPNELRDLPDNAIAPTSSDGIKWIANELVIKMQKDYGLGKDTVDIIAFIRHLGARHNAFKTLITATDIPATLPRKGDDIQPAIEPTAKVLSGLWKGIIEEVLGWGRIDIEEEKEKDRDEDRDRRRDPNDPNGERPRRPRSRDEERRRRNPSSDSTDSEKEREKERKKQPGKKKKRMTELEKLARPDLGRAWGKNDAAKQKKKPDAAHYFYKIALGRTDTRSGGVAVPDRLPWWTSWSSLDLGGRWDALFGDVLRTKSTEKFFASFDAEAYVVSANSRHGHPTPSCLLGLARALEHKREAAPDNWQMRTLYLTNPKSFPRPGLEQLHTVMNTADDGRLLGNALQVRFLKGETYMSLHGKSLEDNNKRLVHEVTEELNITAYQPIYNALSVQMEGGLPFVGANTDYEDNSWFSLYALPQSNGVPDRRHFLKRPPLLQPGGLNVVDLMLALGDGTTNAEKFQLRFPAPADNASWGSSKESTLRMQLRNRVGAEQQYDLQVGTRTYTPSTGARTWELKFKMPNTQNKYMAFDQDDQGVITLKQWKKGANVINFFIEAVTPPTQPALLTQQLVFRQSTFSMMAMSPNAVSRSLRVANNFLTELPVDAGSLTESTPTLRRYLAESTLDLIEGCKGREVLSAIVQERNYRLLDLSLNYQDEILGYVVDLDKSLVDYMGNDLTRGFNEAKILLQVPSNASFTINKNPLSIETAFLRVRWGLDLTLAVETFVVLKRDNLLYSRKEISGAMGTPSLAKVFAHMGIGTSVASQMRLPQVLGILVRDQNKINKLFTDQLPTLLISAGIAKLKPDLDQSAASISFLPGDQIFVDEATLICKIAGIDDWQKNFTVGGLALSINSLDIWVNNSGSSQQRLVFQGEAAFQTEGTSVKLAARYIVGDGDESELQFLLQGEGTSMADVAKQFPNAPTYGTLAVPMSKNLSLDSLKDGMSAIGFTVQQPVPRVPSYVVTSVFATVNFDDWKEYLPQGLVGKAFGKASVKVIVRNPLDSENRAVAMGVSFQIPIPTVEDASKALSLRFSAEPLAVPTEHQYRLTASVSDDGLSIGEAVKALGLDSLSSDSVAAFPALQSLVVDHIFIKTFSVGVDYTQKSLKARDWMVELRIDSLNCILPSDAISIQDILLSVTRTGDTLECSGSARIDLPLVDKLIDIAFKPPRAAMPGYLILNAPYGISIADLLYSFDLPSFDTVPVVNHVLRTQLESAKLSLGVDDKDSKSWTIYGGECTVRLPDALVSVLTLSEARVFVRFNRANDPFGPGKESVMCEITANAFRDAVQAILNYDSFKARFSLSLIPLKELTLAEPLGSLLPTDLNGAISPVIGGLSFRGAAVVLSTRWPYAIKYFRLLLTDESQMEVELWQLKYLSVEYQAKAVKGTSKPLPIPPSEGGKQDPNPNMNNANGGTSPVIPSKPESGKPGSGSAETVKPTKLVVVGVASKGAVSARIRISFAGATTKDTAQSLKVSVEPTKKDSLTARGFLSLLGITDDKLPIEEPPNCPKVFDVSLDYVGGTVSLEKDSSTQKSRLSFRQFRILAHSAGTLDVLNNPLVRLDSIRANVLYKRTTKEGGTRESTVSGFIEGHIEVCGIHVWTRYVRDPVKKVSRFSGLVTAAKFDPSHSKIDFAGISNSVEVPQDARTVPRDLKLPEDLKVSAIGATMIPGQCLEVFARGTALWKGPIAGVDLEIKSLTALVRRKTAINSKTSSVTAVYEVFLKGELVFEGFISAQAWLYLSKDKDSMLTATLTRANPDGNELENMANKMAPGETDSSWKTLVPPSDVPIRFDQAGLFLQVNFKESSFFMYGNIPNVGSALLISMKDKEATRRQFVLFVEVHDLGKLWSSTSSDVLKQFDIEISSVMIINYDTDVESLRKVLSQRSAAKIETSDDKPLDDGKLPEGEPPQTPETLAAVASSEQTTEKLPESTKIGKGAWFFLRVALGNPQQPMTDALCFGVESKERATVTLYAAMTADKSLRRYQVDVRNLTLLGGCLEINGFGEYRPGENGVLTVQGDLALKGLRDDPIMFSVKLEKKKQYTRVDMAVSLESESGAGGSDRQLTGPEVKSPFDSSFPITLKNLQISGEITYSEDKKQAVSEYTLSGTAELDRKGQRKAIISAKVIFRDGKPSAATLQYQPTDAASTSDICAGLIQPDSSKASVWKNDEYDELELKSITAVYLKEAPALKIGTVSYSPGLSIAAMIRFFESDFVAMLTVNLQRKGFVLQATYLGEIELFFAQLCKTGDISGPTMNIETYSGETTTFGFKSGFRLFGQGNFWFDIKYQPARDPKARYFKGNAGYKGTILGKTDPELGIEYKNGRWGFSEWEMFKEMSNSKLPLEKVIEMGSKKDSSCGAIVNLVWKTVVTTKFRFELSLPTDEKHKCTKDELWGTIKWWYNIKFLDKEITDLKLPEIDLRMKSPFTLDALKTKLFDIIVDEKNWASIGESLMNRPADFASLLAAVAFEKLAEDTVAKLLCRGKDYEDPGNSARNRSKDLNDKKIKVLEKALEEALKKAGEVAGEAAAGAIAEGLSAVGGVLGGLGGLIAGLLGAGVGIVIGSKKDDYHDQRADLERAEKEAKEKLEKLQKLLNAARKRLAQALVLSANPSTEFVEGEDNAATVRVSWDKILPNAKTETGQPFDYGNFKDVTWSVAYSTSPGTPDGSSIFHTTGDLSDTASKEGWTFLDVVYVSVRAKFSSRGVVIEASDWTTVAVKHIPWLQSPIGLTYSPSGFSCKLSLPPTLQDVGLYELWLTNSKKLPEKKYLYANRILKTTAGPETVDVPLTLLGPDTKDFESIQARLRQLSTDSKTFHNSPWFLAPGAFALEPAVAGLVAELIAGKVVVSWKQPGLGTRPTNDYQVQVNLKSGALVRLTEPKQQSASEGERRISFGADAFLDGERLSIAVQAISATSTNVLGLVAATDLLIMRPPVPSILHETTYDLSTNSLVLVVWCSLPISDASLVIRFTNTSDTGADRTTLTEIVRSFDSVIGQRGYVRVKLAEITPAIDVTANHSYEVEVQIEDNKNKNRSNASEPWKLHVVPSGLELSADFSLRMLLDGSIRVQWSAGKAGSTRYVRLEEPMSLIPYVEKTWPAEQNAPSIQRSEYGSLTPDAKISVFRMTKGEGFVGHKERTWMSITQERV